MNALFRGLFDDAAIFPPGDLPMIGAVAAHRKRQSSPIAPLLGPFVCSLARWDELAEAAAGGPALAVSLTLPGPDSIVPSAPGVDVVAIEVPGHAERGAAITYVELPCAEITVPRAAALAAQDLRLKIRTGGVRAEAFPSEPELAGALWSAVRGGLAFKLTAGLHDPVRHRDPVTGFEHHGFLNVLLATARALQGYDIERTLADQDTERVVRAVAALDEPFAGLIRRHFVSFGTCSITEPVDGLLSHGLLPEEMR
ncbi:hypothetical protein AB0M02_24280 [Actinoplanes sp. NPDC051861]|uniref:hypothetical protein n=1 Tax=Actinoplanes sp. NPDC051861 TaxID=3155170 RepID=UPI00342B2B02